jgi:hypothetical protein
MCSSNPPLQRDKNAQNTAEIPDRDDARRCRVETLGLHTVNVNCGRVDVGASMAITSRIWLKDWK